jgi:hypothetical protein
MDDASTRFFMKFPNVVVDGSSVAAPFGTLEKAYASHGHSHATFPALAVGCVGRRRSICPSPHRGPVGGRIAIPNLSVSNGGSGACHPGAGPGQFIRIEVRKARIAASWKEDLAGLPEMEVAAARRRVQCEFTPVRA